MGSVCLVCTQSRRNDEGMGGWCGHRCGCLQHVYDGRNQQPKRPDTYLQQNGVVLFPDTHDNAHLPLLGYGQDRYYDYVNALSALAAAYLSGPEVFGLGVLYVLLCFRSPYILRTGIVSGSDIMAYDDYEADFDELENVLRLDTRTTGALLDIGSLPCLAGMPGIATASLCNACRFLTDMRLQHIEYQGNSYRSVYSDLCTHWYHSLPAH